jgi:hypothetical protein
MDLQIDDFYKDTAGALIALYQAFPRRIPLYVEDLVGPEPVDEFGLPSKRHQSCLGALFWLADEGYLRYETRIHYEAIDQAVLTEKSFLRLTRQVVARIEPGLPLGVQRVRASLARQIHAALADSDSELIAQAMRSFLVTDTSTPVD